MQEKTSYALLIDYEYCTGCHSCEVACQKWHDYEPGVYGIKIQTLGPAETAPKQWQFDNVPWPTDLCDHCTERVQEGKQPICVAGCQSKCIEFGKVKDLAEKMTSTHQALFTIVG